MKKIKKIVLAYSGGLDTSVILKWLQDKYKAEIICYTSDLGQEINRKAIYTNAKKLGVKKIIIEDLKEKFVKDYVFPMIRGNALYEGVSEKPVLRITKNLKPNYFNEKYLIKDKDGKVIKKSESLNFLLDRTSWNRLKLIK